jgi:hypothetical protein
MQDCASRSGCQEAFRKTVVPSAFADRAYCPTLQNHFADAAPPSGILLNFFVSDNLLYVGLSARIRTSAVLGVRRTLL